MKIISRCDNNKIRLLTGSPLELLYSKLKVYLGAELMSFFSKPTVKNNETLWSIDFEGDIYPVNRLDSETKAQAASLIESRRIGISNIIERDPELLPVIAKLFIVPSENEIYCYYDEKQRLVVVLSQWACSRLDHSSTTDALSFFVGSSITNRRRIKLNFTYSDGLKAANYPFIFEYNEISRSLSVDSEGTCDLGFLKLSSDFIISLDSNTGTIAKTFRVAEDSSIYHLVIPRPANLRILVVGEDELPITGQPVEYEFEGATGQLLTNSDGFAFLSELEAGKIINVRVQGTTQSLVQHLLIADDNELVFKIVNQQVSTLVVRTEQPDGVPVPDIRFFLQQATMEPVVCHSDSKGIFTCNSLKTGDSVSIFLNEGDKSHSTFIIREGENTFRLVIKPEQIPAMVRICLMKAKNMPVPGAGIEISLNSGQVNCTTGDDGSTSIPLISFSEGEKVSLLIDTKVDSDKRNKFRKRVKKSFTFNGNQREYIINLRERPSLWWLLIFLLPILLFVRCEKDVQVRVLGPDGVTPLQDVTVYFEYSKTFLYNQGAFFTSELVASQRKTGRDGLATFEKRPYSIYSWIFSNLSESILVAHSTCVCSDTTKPIFHHISSSTPLEIKVNPVPIFTDFQVLDASDNQPLPDAKIIIVTNYSGYAQTDSAVSDANGKVVFRRLPKCGKLLKIMALMDGYHPDSLGGGTVEYFMTGKIDDRRTLKLKPVTDKIVFFVTNCLNNQPIPDAAATITLEYENGIKRTQKINTNVNGVGKGSYDDAHVIAEVGLVAEKKYFKQGAINKKYIVRDFVKLTDSLRTICLEPETNPVDFVDVDAKTKQPLAGVANVITIVNGGKETRKETVLSNANGVFTVGGVILGDMISIHASSPPNYSDNGYTVRDKDAIKLLEANSDQRIIPLKPREVVMVFRTIDSTTDSLVSDATLTVTVDGSSSLPSNSGSGTFNVRAPYSSIISIIAEKLGYEKNDFKVKNKVVSYLLTADQSERDIPMKLKPEVKIELTIFNHNKEPDEVFVLMVNNVMIDTISHTSKEATRSTFEIMMMPETDNIIELLFQKVLSDKDKDTGSMILLQPGNISVKYNGDEKSYRFRYNKAKNILTPPETY